jgi:hypothetical protein
MAVFVAEPLVQVVTKILAFKCVCICCAILSHISDFQPQNTPILERTPVLSHCGTAPFEMVPSAIHLDLMPTTTARAVYAKVDYQLVLSMSAVWSVVVVLEQPQDAALGIPGGSRPLGIHLPLALEDTHDVLALKLNGKLNILL